MVSMGEAVEGGYYAIEGEEPDGVTFRLAKVLKVDGGGVHLRFYVDRFPSVPDEIDLGNLTTAIGHLPVSADQFNDWETVLVLQVPVSDEELEGYRYWLEDGGGYLK